MKIDKPGKQQSSESPLPGFILINQNLYLYLLFSENFRKFISNLFLTFLVGQIVKL